MNTDLKFAVLEEEDNTSALEIDARRKRRPTPEKKKRRTGCRNEIPSEQKSVYTKAFIVWALFTLGGWLSIPNEYLPLFSHCVGFGFFLTITTRRTRWLGALAIGALVFSTLMYASMPMEWFSMVSHSAGYIAMGFALVVACLCTTFVAPQSIRDGVKKNELYLKGSLFLEEMTRSLAMAPGQGQAENVKHSGEESPASPEQKDRQTQILESAPREGLCAIIKQLNMRLMARDEEFAKLKEATAQRSKKFLSQIDSEVEKRLRAETMVARQEEQIKSLTEQLQREHEKHIMPIVSLEKQLKDSQEQIKRLTEDVIRIQQEAKRELARKVEAETQLAILRERKGKIEQDLASAIETKSKEEKKVATATLKRTKVEKQLQDEKEARKKAEAALNLQLKQLSESHKEEIKKLHDQVGVETKKRHKFTTEVSQKAECLVLKQQEKIEQLESELKTFRQENRSHRRLASSLIGGALTPLDLASLSTRQLELLNAELERGTAQLDEAMAARQSPLRIQEEGTGRDSPSSFPGSPMRFSRPASRASFDSRSSPSPRMAIQALRSLPHSPAESRSSSPSNLSRTPRNLDAQSGRWSEIDKNAHQASDSKTSDEEAQRLRSLINSVFSSTPTGSPQSSPSSSMTFKFPSPSLRAPPPMAPTDLSGFSLEPSGGASTWPSRRLSQDALCRVCLTKAADSIIYPCGHICLCSSCASKTPEKRVADGSQSSAAFCPLCHSMIASFQSLTEPVKKSV